MNTKQHAILECGNCNALFETMIWTEITVGEDPKLNHDIFQDRLNFFECGDCDNFGFAIYPVSITDRESGERAMAMPLLECVAMSEPEIDAYGFLVFELTEILLLFHFQNRIPLQYPFLDSEVYSLI